MAIQKPGEAEILARDMHFIWIVDCSGSMQVDGKMAQLNNAIKEAIPDMRKVEAENPFAKILVRAVKFSNGAQWHISQPLPVADFTWADLEADGVTDMGAGFVKLAEQLTVDKMGSRGFPPVLVLITDGMPTDDWKKGLKQLMEQPWGKRATRIAIAIGRDADHEPLKAFVGNVERPILQANNPQDLVNYIQWASAAVSKSVIAPPSQTVEGAAGEPEAPPETLLPPPPEVGDDAEVW
jgi:uncharacterized protein YegL